MLWAVNAKLTSAVCYVYLENSMCCESASTGQELAGMLEGRLTGDKPPALARAAAPAL